MKIDEQFNLVAKEYDEGRRRFIPCFDDFYEGATDFIVRSIPTPRLVLDLGAGTGLLTSYWYKNLPDTDYLLVDVADQMLEEAKMRFEKAENMSYEVLDYKDSLPDMDFDVIISALSIHHLEDEEKRNLFTRIYKKLPNGGIFVNYDQFCAETAMMNDLLNTYWISKLEHSGLSERELSRWRERQKFDRECTVSSELGWLKESGFINVQCIYTNQKFSVLMAVK